MKRVTCMVAVAALFCAVGCTNPSDVSSRGNVTLLGPLVSN